MKRLLLGAAPIALLGPVAALGLVAPSAPAPGSTAAMQTGVARSVDPAALRLLDKAAGAGQGVRYRGTQFVSAWTAQGSTGLVVTVTHRPGAGTTVRAPATAWTRAAASHVADGTGAPSLLGGGSTLSLLGKHYDLALGTADAAASVAGRPADVVVVRRPGSARPAARFWLDRETGLVLRREVYDEQGRVIRASAFVELTVGTAATVDADAMTSSDGTQADATPKAWPNALPQTALDRMRGRGWDCPQQLSRSLQLVDARRGGGDYDGIVHLSYSDGLASVSLFEQRGALSTEHLEGYRKTTVRGRHVWVRDEVPQRVVWASDGTVYTLVADATPRTVEDVVAALPHSGDTGGPLGRLGRGLDRVASWFNPFG